MHNPEHYFIETSQGVIVDISETRKGAKTVAKQKNKNPRLGTLPCRVYYCDSKGRKVYINI